MYVNLTWCWICLFTQIVFHYSARWNLCQNLMSGTITNHLWNFNWSARFWLVEKVVISITLGFLAIFWSSNLKFHNPIKKKDIRNAILAGYARDAAIHIGPTNKIFSEKSIKSKVAQCFRNMNFVQNIPKWIWQSSLSPHFGVNR